MDLPICNHIVGCRSCQAVVNKTCHQTAQITADRLVLALENETQTLTEERTKLIVQMEERIASAQNALQTQLNVNEDLMKTNISLWNRLARLGDLEQRIWTLEQENYDLRARAGESLFPTDDLIHSQLTPLECVFPPLKSS